jgi:hypothetical protein
MTAEMNEDCISDTFFVGSLYKRGNVNFVFDECMSQQYYEINVAISQRKDKAVSFNLFTRGDNKVLSVPSTSLFTSQYIGSITGPTFVFSYDALEDVTSQINFSGPVIWIARDIYSCTKKVKTSEYNLKMCDLIVFPNQFFKSLFESTISKNYGRSIVALPQSAEDYTGLINYATKKQETIN